MKLDNEYAKEIVSTLERILMPVPFVEAVDIRSGEFNTINKGIDFIVIIKTNDNEFKFVGEMKEVLQPRQAHDAIRQIKDCCSITAGVNNYPIIASEYISARTADVIKEYDVSYFDLSGNCRISFANVYIERQGAQVRGKNPRRIKSLFGMKSSRMLRLMLNNPMRPWQIKEIAERTQLSFGQVSNIRRALLEQEYAIESEQGGIQITQPSALLNDWRERYKKDTAKTQKGYYTLLSIDEKERGIKEAIEAAKKENTGIVLSKLSAANLLAPYAKSVSEYFYANKRGLEILKKYLMLEPVSVGPNIIIEEPKDSFIFKESIECKPGFKCTNAIQTYLDLYLVGGREQEAAEHIESYVLRNTWKNQRNEYG